MNNLLFSLCFIALLASCSKSELEQSGTDLEETTNSLKILTNPEAQRKFAVILSKAVSNNKDVRIFLKNEALEQFDNDYDVFYPFVKDKVVANDQTFREILLEYCESETELLEIEQTLTLLNIYVPDLRLFWNFSAENWDANDDKIAVICRNDSNRYVYAEGKSIGKLGYDEIPGFACLVVKDNERMTVDPSTTKSGSPVYSFIDDAFDGSKNSTTKSYTAHIPLESIPDPIAYAPASDLDPSVIKAYNEFGTYNGYAHRDHVYYGMTKNNNKGTYRPYFMEQLYALKISASAFGRIADDRDVHNNDPQLKHEQGKWYRRLSREELIGLAWLGGNFEISIKPYTFVNNTQVHLQEIRGSVKATELFAITSVHIDHRNKTWFRNEYNLYTYDKANLHSKWFYFNKNSGFGGRSNARFGLEGWNLYANATKVYFDVYEVDKGVNVETESFVEVKNVVKFSSENSVTYEQGGVSMTNKNSYGTEYSTTTNVKIKTSYKADSDLIGSFYLDYNDPIIANSNEKSTKGYALSPIGSADIEMVFIPKRRY